jgi:integrase/recombinase XerD
MNITLEAAVRRFLAGVAGEVSESTRAWYGRCLSSFVAFLGPEAEVSAIVSDDIREYRAHLLKPKSDPKKPKAKPKLMSAYSVHGRQRAVRRLFSWLVEEGVLAQNVAQSVALVRLPTTPPKAVADDDLARLLEQLPAESVRDRAAVLFLIDTGCRVGGLCSVTLESLDLAHRCAVVTEKGGRSRRVYFTELTAEVISLYLAVRPAAKTDALFVSAKGGGLTPAGIRMLLERIGGRAGVKGRINAHSFRHAFARNFLRNGGNLAVLGRLLGHSPGSPVTAKFYAVFDDREIQEFHDRYSPLAYANGNGRAGDR